MKILSIIVSLCALLISGSVFALTQIPPVPEKPGIQNPDFSLDKKHDTDKRTENTDEFSGHYLFEGKMFYYDQVTGELTPVNSASEKLQPKDLAESGTDEKEELLEELRQEESSFEENYKRPISLSALSSGSQEFGSEILSCKEWGSPIIKNKIFSSKDECEDELQREKEAAMTAIDKYLEEFEKEKTALMIKSDLEEYERLSKIKLKKEQTIQTILRVFKKGCKCRY